MKITKAFLAECENYISEGETEEVINRLMSVKEETAYEREIMNISSQWSLLDRETMSGLKSEKERD